VKKNATRSREFSDSVIDAIREPLIVLDYDLRVVSASRSFYQVFKVKPEETMGQLIYDLGNKQWDIPKLRELLETILPQKAAFDNNEVEHDFADIGRRVMLLNARQIERVLGKDKIILLAIEDVTERKRIEAGLENTRKELAVVKQSADEAGEFAENIINTVREPLIALDQNLRVVKVSNSFYEFFKVKPEETMGQLIYDLGNKQWDIPKLRELLETILPQKATFDNYEVEHDFADIGRRVMLLNARQIERVLGKDKIILLAIEDITERKQSENILTESEERYRRVFETASDAIVLFEKCEGKITHANPVTEEMLGYTKEEIIGHKLPDIGVSLDTDDFQTTMHNLNKNGIINYTNVSIKTRSGQYIDTDIYLADRTKLVQCNIRDIAGRRQAQEELKRSEENFRLSLDDSPLGVRIATKEGETIYTNKVFLNIYGYDRVEELKKVPMHKRYTPESYADFQLRKEKRLNGEFGPSEYETSIVKKNGEVRHVYVYRKEILWNGARQFQIIYQDITDRKRTEAKLLDTLDSLRKSLGTTIQVMISAVEMKDPYTAGHQIRVANLARDIAAEMGLSQNIIEGISMAGSIHDIGKLSIPAEILSKPSNLTNNEFSLIKEHSRNGYEMLKNVESPWPLAQIVYQHHERMNGSGYPKKLKGNKIIIEARIMAVADVVEAMASHRPYRASLGIEAALAEIEKNKGIIYDDTVVDTCVRLFRDKGYQLL
jgi:PAS domain S-box-containing protein